MLAKKRFAMLLALALLSRSRAKANRRPDAKRQKRIRIMSYRKKKSQAHRWQKWNKRK